ncbi:MAG TPA: hypothetical protein VHZ98_11360 [Galbitalea sp.]|nr:hypothetical protein [Galbitalea sp.]
MPRYQAIEVKSRLNRFCCCNVTYRNKPASVRTVDRCEVGPGDDMNLITYARKLRYPSHKRSAAGRLANQFKAQPARLNRFSVSNGWRGSSANPRDHANEIRESNGNSCKAADLPDAVRFAGYENETVRDVTVNCD